MPNEFNPADFAAMKADLEHVRQTLDILVRDVKPILMARSGDLSVISGMQRDLTSSHEKHREHQRRIDRLEKRVDRTTWLVLGAWAVIQVVWSILGPRLTQILGG